MKNIILIIISVFLMHALQAQTDSCKVNLDKIAGKYSGKCQNGLANGKGKSVGEDTYSGIFKDGLPHGKGKYTYKNGDIFQGYWKNGQKDGKGKFTYHLNGKKMTLQGYWKNDEYVGATDPDLHFRVSSATGIASYDVVQKESGNAPNEINFSIKSAFTDFVPQDLKINNSSGQIVQSGKKFGIKQYFCPLHCEISYTILVGEIKKQCRFIIDIFEEGHYVITLSND